MDAERPPFAAGDLERDLERPAGDLERDLEAARAGDLERDLEAARAGDLERRRGERERERPRPPPPLSARTVIVPLSKGFLNCARKPAS